MNIFPTLLIIFTLIVASVFSKSEAADVGFKASEAHILKKLYGTQLMLDELNLAAIESLIKCMELPSSGSYQNRLLDAMEGEILDIHMACSEAIKTLIHKPIENNFSEMRIHLALSAPLRKDANPLFQESFSPNYEELRWSTKLSHKARGLGSIKLKPLTTD